MNTPMSEDKAMSRGIGQVGALVLQVLKSCSIILRLTRVSTPVSGKFAPNMRLTCRCSPMGALYA